MSNHPENDHGVTIRTISPPVSTDSPNSSSGTTTSEVRQTEQGQRTASQHNSHITSKNRSPDALLRYPDKHFDDAASSVSDASVRPTRHRRCYSAETIDDVQAMLSAPKVPKNRRVPMRAAHSAEEYNSRHQWLDTIAALVQSTDPAWFTRYQMDLHHPVAQADLDMYSKGLDEESSRVYLIKSRYGNLRGAESKRTLAELEEAGVMADNTYTVQSDDEVAANPNQYWSDDFSDDDPLRLELEEVDLAFIDDDQDKSWWMRHFLKRKSAKRAESLHEIEDPLIAPPNRPSTELRSKDSHLIGRRQGVLAILKGFVGTGMLFLPHAIAQGGLLFSSSLLIIVCFASIYSMVLLIDCADSCPLPKNSSNHSFGSIGRAAMGKAGSALVNISVFMAQMGFCCVYSVFVSRNIGDVIATKFHTHLATSLLIYCLIPLLIPVSWIRQLKHLAPAILVANTFVSTASITIIIIAIGIVALSGPSPNLATFENLMINGSTWPLTLGFTLYVWEGIGLVIPIKNSLVPNESAGPRFASTLTKTVICILFLYLSFGGLLFCTYGENVNQVILLSLPETPLTVLLQLMFTISCLCSFPLQFFPAARIMERLVMTRMIERMVGVDNLSQDTITWLRNLTRSLLVLMTIAVAISMQDRLDLLTSFIGCLCCLPLSLIYPVLFHLLTRPDVERIGEVQAFDQILDRNSRIRKWPIRPVNYTVITGGVIAMIFTGQQTTKAFLDYLHPVKPPATTVAPTHGPTITPRPSDAPVSTATPTDSHPTVSPVQVPPNNEVPIPNGGSVKHW